MNKSLLRGSIVLGIVSVAAGCVSQGGGTDPDTDTDLTVQPNGIWKCFTIDDTDPSPPHAEEDDKFCVAERASAWYLVPGQGMENWKPIGGNGTEIPLTWRQNGKRTKSWDFDVEIDNHPAGSGHGPEHAKPDRGFLLTVKLRNPKAKTDIKVVGGPETHGGTAHGVED
jgi:hypothetical protein